MNNKLDLIQDDKEFGVMLNQAFDSIGLRKNIVLPYKIIDFTEQYLPYIDSNFQTIGTALNITLEPIDTLNKYLINKNLETIDKEI